MSGVPTISSPVTRRSVLEHLAAESEAEPRESTTIETLAATLDADVHAVESHLRGLEACEMARVAPDGEVRVTVTGEELLALDAAEMAIVDSTTPTSGR